MHLFIDAIAFIRLVLIIIQKPMNDNPDPIIYIWRFVRVSVRGIIKKLQKKMEENSLVVTIGKRSVGNASDASFIYLMYTFFLL